MRIQHQNLTAINPAATIRYPERDIEYLFVVNNNPAPVYIRLGSPEIPNQRNFDVAIPPMYVMAISVNSTEFGIRLGDDNVNAALLTGITTVEGMIDERPPVVGGVPIQAASLSTADIGNGFQSFSGPVTIGPFNLTLWGGIEFFLLPNSGSGQGVIVAEVSSDLVTWRGYGTWAFWPGVPVNLNLPRVANFVRFTLNTVAIPGNPTIAGFRSVRATLAEIQQVDFNPGGNQLSQAYAFAALGSQTFVFTTLGIPAISVRVNVATGSRQELIWYTGPTPTGPWSLAAFREQSVAGFYNSIYRAIGNLDAFLQVVVTDIGNNSGTGTLSLSIPGQPDLTAYLQGIFAALGDVGQPVNANQSVYHELDTIRTTLSTWLPSIDARIATSNITLSSMDSRLATIVTNTGNAGTIVTVLSDIRTNTSNAAALLTSIDSRIATVNTNLSTIITNTGNIKTSVDTVNTTLGTTNTRLQSIITQLQSSAQPLDILINLTNAGVWYNTATAVLTGFSGGNLLACLPSFHTNTSIASAGGTLKIAMGDATNPIIVIYTGMPTVQAIGATINATYSMTLPLMTYVGSRSAGLFINPSYLYIWATYDNVNNARCQVTLAVEAP